MMNRQEQFLRDIVSSVSLSSETELQDKSDSELEDSLLEVNGDDFRLDKHQSEVTQSQPAQIDKSNDDSNIKKLFVEDDTILSTPETSMNRDNNEDSPKSTTPQVDESYYDEVSSIRTPVSKKVRFNSAATISREEEALKQSHPWDFKNRIHKEFRERLPNNYEIKNWKRPSKKMLMSIMDVLENNVEPAVQSVLDKYGEECERVVGQGEIQRIRQNKETLLFELIRKIKQKLRKAKFPSRVSDQDMDIEYIFAKRKFIQERYSRELQHSEVIEHQLLREQKKLEDLKTFETKLSNRGLKEVTLLKNQLTLNLHPVLNKAVVNSFGLIADQTANNHRFEKDVQNMNLEDSLREGLSDVLNEEQNRDSLLERYLPAFKSYEEANNKLQNCIHNHLEINKDALEWQHTNKNDG